MNERTSGSEQLEISQWCWRGDNGWLLISHLKAELSNASSMIRLIRHSFGGVGSCWAGGVKSGKEPVVNECFRPPVRPPPSFRFSCLFLKSTAIHLNDHLKDGCLYMAWLFIILHGSSNAKLPFCSESSWQIIHLFQTDININTNLHSLPSNDSLN